MHILYLVRHGDKIHQKNDPELSEIGIVEAEKTGTYLSQFPISYVVASPTKRTTETASIIANQVKCSVEVDDRLVERMDWENTNFPFEEFLQEWAKTTQQRGYVPAQGDSSIATGKRISDLVTDLNTDDLDFETHTVLVSHGGAIIDYLRNTFDDTVVHSLLKNIPKLGFDYEYKTCAVTRIEIDGETEPKIIALHETHHLE